VGCGAGVIDLHTRDDYQSFTVRLIHRGKPGIGRTFLRAVSARALVRSCASSHEFATHGYGEVPIPRSLFSAWFICSMTRTGIRWVGIGTSIGTKLISPAVRRLRTNPRNFLAEARISAESIRVHRRLFGSISATRRMTLPTLSTGLVLTVAHTMLDLRPMRARIFCKLPMYFWRQEPTLRPVPRSVRSSQQHCCQFD